MPEGIHVPGMFRSDIEGLLEERVPKINVHDKLVVSRASFVTRHPPTIHELKLSLLYKIFDIISCPFIL